jgi:hypothetical protein
MKKLVFFITFAILLVIVGNAYAITVQRDIEYNGSGYIQVGNNSYNLTNVVIKSYSDGRVFMNFSGDGDWILEGNWYYADFDNIYVDLDFTGDTPLSGQAGISFDNGQFGEVVAAGQVNDENFILNFNSYVRTDYNAAIPQLHLLQMGNGTYVNADKTIEFDEIGIDLDPDGNASITLYGSTNLTINGSWQQRTIDSVKIDVNEIDGSSDLGSGIMLLQNINTIDLLSMSGNTGNQQWNINFSNL